MTFGRIILPAIAVFALVAALHAPSACAEGDGAKTADHEDGKTPESEGGEKTEQEYRYDFKVINGQLLKVDRKTGSIVVIDASGMPTKLKKESSKPVELSIDRPRYQPEIRRNNKPVIDSINGESVENEDRDSARREVAEYGSEIGISQALQVDGEKISGLVRITNNGQKRLTALELTLYVPTASNKTVEHRIVMAEKKGYEPPPPPNKSGSALNKVDFAVPDVVKGQLEIKVTYLKFADQ